jgi:electron transfer flavoprotein alpha/beta subunit
MPVTHGNVDDVFSYHAPTDGQPQRYEAIREGAKGLAKIILIATPACADQQAALRLLREVVMTANAAIALNGAV